jgi:DNA-directed RNA polymerase specialized sigma24 family protein
MRTQPVGGANDDDATIEQLVSRWRRCRRRREKDRIFAELYRKVFAAAMRTYLATAGGFTADRDEVESDVNYAIFRAATAAREGQPLLPLFHRASRNAALDANRGRERLRRSNGLPVLPIEENILGLAHCPDLIGALIVKEERRRIWRKIRRQLDRRGWHVLKRWMLLGWSKERIAESLNRRFPRGRRWKPAAVKHLVFRARSKLRLKKKTSSANSGRG